MNAADFAQGHEQNVMVPEADDLRERRAIVPGGLDPANFADGGERPLGLNDQADELDHAAMIADDLGFLNSAQQAL
jgi:hypothetical protein